MNKLEVKTRKIPFVAIVLLGIFFVSMGLGLLVSAVSSDSAIVPLGIGLLCLTFYSAILWMFISANRKSVKHFTNESLTRNDGRQLAWTELSHVVKRTTHNPRTNRLVLRRCEIEFKNGEAAWLIPARISNFQEVIGYVNRLPCEQLDK